MTIKLENLIIGNGGGSVKTMEDVIQACKTSMTDVEIGSVTLDHRPGNIEETYYFHPRDLWSLNALGLPNPGRDYYRKWLPEMVLRAHDAGKRLRANIAPFSPRESGQLAEFCLQARVDDVIINGSCPNVWDGGKHGAIPALNPTLAEAMLEETRRFTGTVRNMSFKLSPTDDIELVRKLVVVFRKFGVLKLVCCNTKGGQQGMREDGVTPALAFRAKEGEPLRHEGGLAGREVYQDNLNTADMFITEMPEAEVVGLGGIFTGVHANEYLHIGCVGVQSTTAYLEYKGRIFEEILMYLSENITA